MHTASPSAPIHFAAALRAGGLRVTRLRLAVLAVLDDASAAHEHLPASAVTQGASGLAGSITKQATYDCLEALAGAGLIREVEPAG